jgi:hypothetical protein
MENAPPPDSNEYSAQERAAEPVRLPVPTFEIVRLRVPDWLTARVPKSREVAERSL